MTFDCYGTLIDWDAGVRSCLSALWLDADADADVLLARYHEIEPRLQLGRSVPYRQVLDESLAEIASTTGHEIPAGKGAALSDSLPAWPPFVETHDVLSELRALGWKLAILSNTDPDLLASSVALIDVPIDLRVTAAEAGSYKPAFGHWETFFRQERSGSRAARARGGVVVPRRGAVREVGAARASGSIVSVRRASSRVRDGFPI